MTVLDQFVAFAKDLPADRREPLDEVLGAIMATYSTEHAFSDAEAVELDRRVAEPKPEYSSPATIAELLGKRFKA
ncbi:hypothetical protein [Pelagerythrobacter sp.]|uniref:hypothetical protein n=1 Tax=Pelagerythrobacter sp. TaxID=2800702 RepID=UPI0035AE03BF